MRFHLILISIIGLALAACGSDEIPERSAAEMAQIAATAANLRPGDARLAEVYERSCANCHGIEASGAPLTGDTVAWAPRLRKGNADLLANTIIGFEGMPPMGLCPDCTADEFAALIEFMSSATH